MHKHVFDTKVGYEMPGPPYYKILIFCKCGVFETYDVVSGERGAWENQKRISRYAVRGLETGKFSETTTEI